MQKFGHLLTTVLARVNSLVSVIRFVFVILAILSAVYSYTRASTSAPVFAATSSHLNYQAKLMNADGSTVANGYYNVEFKLYDQESGGTTLWTESRYDTNGATSGNDSRVRVVNGYMSVNLGSVNPFPNINWDRDLWLTLNVGNTAQTSACGAPFTTPYGSNPCSPDGEMLPRIKLTAVPYAFQAQRAAQLSKLSGGFTGILDFLSLTDNRTIDLPDASGTVVLDTTGFLNGGSSFNGLATLGTNDTNGLVFETDGLERLRIAAGGNVGIDTGGDAVEKLEVNGGIKLGNTSNANAGTLRWTGTDFEGFDGTEWKSLTLGGALSVNPTANVRKSADETQNSTVNATAALQDDDDLRFAIGANETWSFRFVITANANATPDIKFAVTAPSGAVCRVGVQDAEGAVAVGNLGCGVSSGLIAGNTTEDVYEVTGTVVNGATAGNITLQWAQNTANAASTIVRQGSYLNAQRISGPGQTATPFLQGGNSFLADAQIGTNDGFGLQFLTNGVTRGSFDASGLMTLLNGLDVSGGVTLSTGNLNLESGGLQLNGTDVITSAGVLQNVTANTGILTSGQLGAARGGTGVDGSAAANGQLLIGNGSGFSLGTLANNGGLTVTNSAGGIGLAVNYGSGANTAVQGDTGLVCASGTGNLSGGGNTITLGSGGTCGAITMSNAVSFTTSVTTPLVTNNGALTLNTAATAGADDVIFQVGGTERMRLLENGRLVFGTGANSANFYLSANDTLRTDDSLVVGAGLTVEGTTTLVSVNTTGLVDASGGLTVLGAVSINASGGGATNIGTGSSTGAISVGSGSNAFSLNSSAFDVSSTGALSGISTLSASGAITAATSTNTINGLVINSGSLSSITGFSQTGGNFTITGTGTFSTGTGGVNLNSATTIANSTTGAGLSINQTGDGLVLGATATARTSGALISLTHNTSAFTGTGLLLNFASGSGTFASGNFLDFQLNGTSRFKVDSNGGLTVAASGSNGLMISNSSGLDYLSVDMTANTVRVGDITADGTGVLFVLDTKNTTGDPTGVNGGSYYNSFDKRMRCFEDNIWKDCIVSTATPKTANQTVTNSATFTNDSNLFFPMEANSAYTFTAAINISGTSAAADYKYTFTVPTGAVVYVQSSAPTAAGTSTACNISASGQTCTVAITANFRGTLDITGYVDTAGTAGNLQFQFAQNTQTAGQSVTVYAGSSINWKRTLP